MSKRQIRVSIDESVLQAIDRDKGTLTRSDYINDILFFATASEEQLQELINFSET